MSVAVGDPAPEFELSGTGGRKYALSEYRGQPVVLIGERGQGKSHLLAALYHGFASPELTSEWLGAWAIRLGQPKIAAINSHATGSGSSKFELILSAHSGGGEPLCASLADLANWANRAAGAEGLDKIAARLREFPDAAAGELHLAEWLWHRAKLLYPEGVT